ncbi:hypothetical protein [Variovorax sp. Root411]|uniref:hypothetical protein n=1 Tax=Variovorax sp. Root411 TaxID=1736530 RepID=UPI000AE6D636|nr:hypothetical protein [Variovorax sp. Root411]
MTSNQHPTRRQALQRAAGILAMAALPLPAPARLQAPIEPSANVLWKPMDDTSCFGAPFEERITDDEPSH